MVSAARNRRPLPQHRNREHQPAGVTGLDRVQREPDRLRGAVGVPVGRCGAGSGLARADISREAGDRRWSDGKSGVTEGR